MYMKSGLYLIPVAARVLILLELTDITLLIWDVAICFTPNLPLSTEDWSRATRVGQGQQAADQTASVFHNTSIILSVERKQRRGYRTADLRLCFCIHTKSRFSHDTAHMLIDNGQLGVAF